MPKFPLNGIILTADISLLPLIFSYLFTNKWLATYLPVLVGPARDIFLVVHSNCFLWQLACREMGKLWSNQWLAWIFSFAIKTSVWEWYVGPPPFPFSFQPQMLQVRNVALPFHTFCYSALLKTLMEAPKLISSLRSIANDMVVGFFHRVWEITAMTTSLIQTILEIIRYFDF